MKLKIEIDLDNASFEDYSTSEIKRCLKKVQEKLEAGQASGKVMDTNGNSVGSFEMVND